MGKFALTLIVIFGLELFAAGCTSVSARGGFDLVEQKAQECISRLVP